MEDGDLVGGPLLMHYMEHFVSIWWRMGDFPAANHHLSSEIVGPCFSAIPLWLLVLILAYCASRELVRGVGRDKVTRMFFGSPVLRRS